MKKKKCLIIICFILYFFFGMSYKHFQVSVLNILLVVEKLEQVLWSFRYYIFVFSVFFWQYSIKILKKLRKYTLLVENIYDIVQNYI